ncbi:39978_t:CDS:2, partial [Gigaspora margarita]
MSAVATKIVEKYNLTSKMSVSELSQYTSEFLENLTDDRKRNQARRRLRDGFKFSNEQRSGKAKAKHEVPCSVVNLAESSNRVTTPPDSFQVPDLTSQNSEETIRDLAQRILRDKLSIQDIRAEAYALALSAKNVNAGSSRLSRLRRELKSLSATSEIIKATKFPDITKKANEIQQNRRKFVEAFERIDYPDHFTLESVKERLDKYDISTLPDIQALADIIIMLCIRPAELTSLRITDAGVMGKPGCKWFNRFLKDYDLIPRHLRKLGAVYGAVVHGAQNPAHVMTIARECLRHNTNNHTSPVQNYVV